jgi:hypothetical protein
MNLSSKAVLALLAILLAIPAMATDVATLRNGFTIRHESRAPLGETTRLFLTSDGGSFIDVPSADIVQIEHDSTPPPAVGKELHPVSTTPAPLGTNPTALIPKGSASVDVGQVVDSASDKYRLDPDLVNSVIRAESGFKVHAVSPKGAQGLMQLMPQTASKLGVPNAFDPAANVDGGTKYLRELLERYNFDLIKALAAYNAGPHRVEQYGGVPPYRETRKYVASIVRDFNRKKLAQQKAAKAVASAKPTQRRTNSTARAQSAQGNTTASAKKSAVSTGN